MIKFVLIPLLVLGFGALALGDDHVYRRSMGNNPDPYALHNPRTNPLVAPGAHVPGHNYRPNPHKPDRPHNPHYKPYDNYRNNYYHYRVYPYYYPYYSPYYPYYSPPPYYYYYYGGTLYGPGAIFGIR